MDWNAIQTYCWIDSLSIIYWIDLSAIYYFGLNKCISISNLCVSIKIACRACVCVLCVHACVVCVCVCNAEVDTRQLQRHVSAGRTNKFFGRYF